MLSNEKKKSKETYKNLIPKENGNNRKQKEIPPTEVEIRLPWKSIVDKQA